MVTLLQIRGIVEGFPSQTESKFAEILDSVKNDTVSKVMITSFLLIKLVTVISY